MKKTKKYEFDEVELLEKQISQKIDAYKDFKNSEANERYFYNLHFKSMNKMEEKKSNTLFSFNPAISYAILFIISFAVSFQLIDFNYNTSVNNEQYLFSDTSLWIEEEEYLSNILEEDFNLDYASYISSELELNYSSSISLIDEINQLSDSELDEIYENIKYKKIL